MMPLNTTYTLWHGVVLVNPTKLEDVDLNECPKLSIKDFFRYFKTMWMYTFQDIHMVDCVFAQHGDPQDVSAAFKPLSTKQSQ